MTNLLYNYHYYQWEMYRDKDVKKFLENFIFVHQKDVLNYIFNYYQIYDQDEIFKLASFAFRFIEQQQEIGEKYPDCVMALEYEFKLRHAIIQNEVNAYDKRIDIIQDLNISNEIRELIVNTYQKDGYTFGLRIRRIPQAYAIYWDKIQLNNICFKDLNFYYMKELIKNGKEKTEEKIRRLLR